MLQVLIEHGHSKDAILNEYSKEEATLFYEKCIKQDTRQRADQIEAVMAGIGGAFSGGKKMSKLLQEMRE